MDSLLSEYAVLVHCMNEDGTDASQGTIEELRALGAR
jgi:hypothetical protein